MSKVRSRREAGVCAREAVSNLEGDIKLSDRGERSLGSCQGEKRCARVHSALGRAQAAPGAGEMFTKSGIQLSSRHYRYFSRRDRRRGRSAAQHVPQQGA